MSSTLLYLSESVIPSNRANAVQISAMCEAFGQIGLECRLLHLAPSPGAVSEEFPPPGARYAAASVNLFAPVFKGVQVVSCARTAFRAMRPDYVYGRSLASILAVSRKRGRSAFEAHMMPGRELSKAGILWRMMSLQDRLGVVAISQALGSMIQSRYRIPDRRIHIYHDCAMPNAHTSQARKAALWTSPRPSAIYAGSLSSGKGIDMVLACAEALPAFDFRILGGDVDAVQRATLMNVPRNVQCLGRVPPSAVSKYLAESQLALLPNQEIMVPYGGGGSIGTYNSPLKLFEYMAAGCVIVASDLPNIREVLPPTVAFYARPASVESWVASIRAAFTCTDRAYRIGFAFNAVASKYNWNVRACSILSFLKNL